MSCLCTPHSSPVDTSTTPARAEPVPTSTPTAKRAASRGAAARARRTTLRLWVTCEGRSAATDGASARRAKNRCMAAPRLAPSLTRRLRRRSRRAHRECRKLRFRVAIDAGNRFDAHGIHGGCHGSICVEGVAAAACPAVASGSPLDGNSRRFRRVGLARSRHEPALGTNREGASL
eukprot:scaffold24509_cov97-Isochrysis_galbana.AAC.2